MKFAVGNIVLNDKKGIERLLESTKKFDIVYVVDGRFQGFDGPRLSDDGTREIVKSYSNAKLIDAPDIMEAPKRQIYFDMAANDGVDFLLQADSDEYVKVDWDEFKTSCGNISKSGNAGFQVIMDYFDLWWREQYPYRLFYQPETCKYENVHNRILCDGCLIQSNNRGIRVGGIRLVHDKSVRTRERETTNKKWYDAYPIH